MEIEKLVRKHLRDIMVYEPGMDEEGYAKLSSNENPCGPHPSVVAAVTDAIKDANRYPLSGSPDLVDALAMHYGVSSGEIMVGNGTNEIIDLLVRAFVDRDHNVVFPVPSFIVYPLVCKQCEIEGIGVDCKDYRLDLAAMRAAVNDKTRMVFICNPNNPTATYSTAAEVDAFLDGLPEDVLVVMDEAYYDYVNASDYPDCMALRNSRNTIVILRTFSKFHSLAGVRVGYAIADPGVVKALHQIRQPFNVNIVAQAAGLAALRVMGDLKPLVKETIEQRDRVRQAMLDLGLVCPESQTNFVFVDLGDRKIDLFRALYEERVVVRRMAQFGSSQNTYRITIGTVEENDRLIEATRKVLGNDSAR
jgi:histidinol-phosphate aminotransferase